MQFIRILETIKGTQNLNSNLNKSPGVQFITFVQNCTKVQLILLIYINFHSKNIFSTITYLT